MKPTLCAEIDMVAIECFSAGIRQRGRMSYPRTSFTGDISVTTKMAAHEFSGTVLVILLLLHVAQPTTEFGKNVIQKLRKAPENNNLLRNKSDLSV
jgi:hypothetical protein